MKRTLFEFVAACIAFAATSVSATTFPSLTTIYVGTGLEDSGDGPNTGTATTIQCSNVSGVAVQIRFLLLQTNGTVAGTTTRNVNHGATAGVTTHDTFYWFEDSSISPSVVINRGTINIESTESGVFCQAFLVNAAGTTPDGVPIRLVRVNAHPGTEE